MREVGIQGCGSWNSYIYFISYMIIVSMCMMNLSVAAVINALTDAKDAEYGEIKEESIDSLIDLWAEYDPNATGFVGTEELVCILAELPPPLGCNFKRYNT